MKKVRYRLKSRMYINQKAPKTTNTPEHFCVTDEKGKPLMIRKDENTIICIKSAIIYEKK
ncbi:MAG: hypothetical protein ACQERX_02075 [Bacillota bacterium]